MQFLSTPAKSNADNDICMTNLDASWHFGETTLNCELALNKTEGRSDARPRKQIIQTFWSALQLRHNVKQQVGRRVRHIRQNKFSAIYLSAYAKSCFQSMGAQHSLTWDSDFLPFCKSHSGWKEFSQFSPYESSLW